MRRELSESTISIIDCSAEVMAAMSSERPTMAAARQRECDNPLSEPHIEDTTRNLIGRCIVRWSYSCPHCNGILNRENSIMLIGTHDDERIIIGFHPAPGNYEISLPPGYEIEAGSAWYFSCPLCQQSLVSYLSPDLCCIDMVAKDVRHRVYFSRIAGEYATFVISAEAIEHFGTDVHRHEHSLEMLQLV